MKDITLRGILSSNHLSIKGDFGSKMPELSGSLLLKEGGIELHHVLIEKIEADFIFAFNKGMSIKGEGLARVVRVGPYYFLKPLDVSLSTTLNGTWECLDMISILGLSSLEIKFKDEKTFSLKSISVTIEGTIKDHDFSGKNSFEIKGIEFADRFISWLKSRSIIDYQKGEVMMRNFMIETEDLKSSANQIRITSPGTKPGYNVEIRGMNAAYRTTEALIKEGDFQLTLFPSKEIISGDLHFSVKNILTQGITFDHISGTGSFDDKNFSMDIANAEVAGGRIKVTADGRTSEKFFPIKTNILAEGIDLNTIFNVVSKSIKLPFHVAGEMKKINFDGTINSLESLNGHASVDARILSVSNLSTGRNFIKDAFLHTDVELMGKDLTFKAEAATAKLSTQISGKIASFIEKGRHLQAEGNLAEVGLSDIRNTFWDIFPDSLLYVGLQGSLSSNVSVVYSPAGLDLNGNILLKDFILEGENGEYSVGPINGTLPIRYGRGQSEKEGMALPSFEKSQFERLSHYYAQEPVKNDFHRLTIGSLKYGFPLLENVNLFIKQKDNAWNIERFSANIFGGKLNGSAIMDLSKGFDCRIGFLVKGMSLKRLCDGIDPIKGFMSGKIDGIGSLKASGVGISKLMGMADFWTYSAEGEKTMISKEFLQKVGGPSLKAYLRNRNFDKGILTLYLKDGGLIFRDLEISNRNFLGMTDLSVKVAPMSNRIGLDHLLWTIAEAGERAKKKK
jgi:hypothetical protein